MSSESNLQTVENTNGEDRVSVASQGQLIWWRFKKHKLAVISLILLVILYLTTAFAEFFATSHPLESEAFRGLIQPQPIHFFDEGKLLYEKKEFGKSKILFEKDIEITYPMDKVAMVSDDEWKEKYYITN